MLFIFQAFVVVFSTPLGPGDRATSSSSGCRSNRGPGAMARSLAPRILHLADFIRHEVNKSVQPNKYGEARRLGIAILNKKVVNI